MIPCSKTSTKMGSYILDYILGIDIALLYTILLQIVLQEEMPWLKTKKV